MALNFLLGQVQNAISNHAGQQQQTGFDPSGLLGEIEGLFNQHAANTGQSILPASQDPYGDPGQNILPASQDPYGDPGQR
ncbi:MAG: hypothetical protein ACRYFS_14010 [Janthinobacterium lividum]